jgi:hypothetical protein
MHVPSSCLRKSLHSLAGCMAAAFSCIHAATATDLAFPDPSYGWVGISDGRWAAASRNSDRIDRLSIALPHYLEGRRRDRLNVTRDSSHPSATLVVTNCDDSGAGSLRDTIASAASGDTVDLSQLTCSTITLTSTNLGVHQNDLMISGPGAASLTIDGGGVLPLLAHYGNGTLSIDGLTLTNGYYYYGGMGYSKGGCMASAGNVSINNSVVSNCTIKGHNVTGGAIYTRNNLTLINSLITHNKSVGIDFAGSGGARVHGDLLLQYSTISDNEALGTNVYSVAGGFHVNGNMRVQNSTVSGNRAKNFAAFVIKGSQEGLNAVISSSTISDNSATGGGAFGGIYTTTPLTIHSSTIAFNTGGGVSGIYAYNAPLVLQSTIIADNARADLGLGGTATVSGANNLIVNAISVPPDTIRACPQLGPLANNGGVTLTHMPRSTSPAVDAGNDNMALMYDQRGTGFPRIFGANADIGAVEWQGGTDEEIFNSGFESICDR